MSYYLMILVGAVLVNNFVLSRFLGCCPFLGVSKKTETALGMSGAVVFVMTVAAAVTWCVDRWLLAPHGLGYIHTLAFILVIAALVQFIDIAMKRFLPALHAALGFGFALLVFSGLRERLAHANPPVCFRGVAVALVAGGLLSLAFMGFSGLVKLPY